MAVRECAAGHQRGHHGDPGQLRQVQQLCARLATDHAAADVEHRLARRGDQLGGLANLLGVRLRVGLVAGQLHRRRPAERALPLQHVLRDVDEHRAGTPGGGDVERLGQHARDVVAVADQVVVLGDRHRDAGDVGLLERVGPDHRPADLAGDRHDGYRVHLRVGDRGDEVGGAGTGSRHAHADAAGGVRVAAGGVTGALLMTHQHMTQLLRVEQRVVNGKHCATRNSEDDVDAELLQRPHHGLRAGELLGRNSFRVTRLAAPVGAAVGGLVARRPFLWWGGRCAHGVLFVLCRLGVAVWIVSRCWARKNPRQLGCCTRVASVDAWLGPGLNYTAPTRRLITTNNPRACIAIDGSLRTGQRSNSGPVG